MWKLSVNKCDGSVWQTCIEHTEKLINEWSEREILLEATVPQIIIEAGNDSDSDTSEEELS
mgnify:CR=1 FL=1